jgi:hypothetical protein
VNDVFAIRKDRHGWRIIVIDAVSGAERNRNDEVYEDAITAMSVCSWLNRHHTNGNGGVDPRLIHPDSYPLMRSLMQIEAAVPSR